MVLSPFLVGFFTSSVATACESYVGAASLGTQTCYFVIDGWIDFCWDFEGLMIHESSEFLVAAIQFPFILFSI